MYEKILVPLDGSELAEVALPYAEELAGKLGSEVTLIYVGWSTDDPHAHMRQFYLQRMVEVIKRSAQESLEKLAAKEIKVKSEVLVGSPAEQIVDYADKENIGLIVMATHGRTGIRRWTLGSVADKVVRATKRPVVLIRAKDAYPEVRETSILNKVLVCLDGSAESEAVIPYIEDLAAKLKAEVILFQVLARAYHVYATEEGAGKVPYTEEEMESLKAGAKSYLEKMGELFKSKDIPVSYEIRVGTAAEEIIKLADEIQADMVAMSTHGRSGVGRWIFGSVTEKIIQQGNTLVLLVRVPEADVK